MTKIKVGDKVKVTYYNFEDIAKKIVGKVFEIKAIEKRNEPFIYELTSGHCVKEKWIQLIKDKKVKGVSKNPRQLKEGDRIRVINNDSSMLNQTGNIVGIRKCEIYPICVELDDGFGCWFNEKDLEILEEPKKESKEIEKIESYGRCGEDIEKFLARGIDKLTLKVNEVVEQVNKLSKEK